MNWQLRDRFGKAGAEKRAVPAFFVSRMPPDRRRSALQSKPFAAAAFSDAALFILKPIPIYGIMR
ncbi:hypothetical protein FHX14_001265 [Rhizobium sp. BK619]|uniref:hypothetical protein n=1 Tax=Rhizobium TaxID=379 RepID=UPI0012F621F9|nr:MULTISPECIES: hypothetical protein [Rhizobium]MBB3645095.1 hypothetical protein [Rhizobium sp. BK619]